MKWNIFGSSHFISNFLFCPHSHICMQSSITTFIKLWTLSSWKLVYLEYGIGIFTFCPHYHKFQILHQILLWCADFVTLQTTKLTIHVHVLFMIKSINNNIVNSSGAILHSFSQLQPQLWRLCLPWDQHSPSWWEHDCYGQGNLHGTRDHVPGM